MLFRDSTLKNTQAKTSTKRLFLDLKNVSISSIMIKVEISQLKNLSPPSEHSVLKTKPNKSSTSFNHHQMLKRWTLVPSLKSSDSLENKTAKPHQVNFSNFLILTKMVPLAHKNSKKSPKALDKTSVSLKLIK